MNNSIKRLFLILNYFFIVLLFILITILPLSAKENEFVKYKKIRIMKSVCIRCGNCAKECPSFALSLNLNSESVQIDRSKCILCGYCTRVCPVLALRIA